MEIDLAVLADAANVTADNKVNLMGIFRNLATPVMPVLLPSFYLALTFTVEENELDTVHNFNILFKNSNNEILQEVGKGEFRIGAQNNYNYPMLNLLIAISNFQMAEYGTYWFEIIFDGELFRKIPLLVTNVVTNTPSTQQRLLNQPK